MAMATRMIPTESQRASAQAHLSQRDQWRAYRVNGVRYYALTSATSGRIYHVRADGAACDCPAYQRGGYSACSHMLSVREAAHHDAMAEWLADQADQLLEEYAAQQANARREAVLTLARLGGFCAEAGCQEDSERGEDFCSEHRLNEVA